MDVFNLKEGDEVIYAYPGNGLEHDQNQCAKLEEGGIYSVNAFEIGNWKTLIELEQHPGEWFNSVMFEDRREYLD